MQFRKLTVIIIAVAIGAGIYAPAASAQDNMKAQMLATAMSYVREADKLNTERDPAALHGKAYRAYLMEKMVTVTSYALAACDLIRESSPHVAVAYTRYCQTADRALSAIRSRDSEAAMRTEDRRDSLVMAATP